jgi:hypothetical protein
LAAILSQYAAQYVTNIGFSFLFHIGPILIAILAQLQLLILNQYWANVSFSNWANIGRNIGLICCLIFSQYWRFSLFLYWANINCNIGPILVAYIGPILGKRFILTLAQYW